jgi:hypothetical protein
MMKISGTRPELLPAAPDMKQVHIGLKKTRKEFGKIDSRNKPSRKSQKK